MNSRTLASLFLVSTLSTDTAWADIKVRAFNAK